MSIQAVLWRVVLCISLILNGSALASPSMPMSPSLHQQSSDRIAAGMMSPSVHSACHERAAGMAIVTGHAHPPSSPMPGKGKHATPDCCAGGSCACVCMPPLPNIADSGFDPTVMHAMRPGHARVRHDEPVLPHLIRPPIG